MNRIAHNVGGQVLVLLITLLVSGQLFARQVTGEMQEVGLESGALSDLREGIGKLLVLDIDNRRRLHLATELWEQYRQSAIEKKNKRITQLIERGLSEEKAKEFADATFVDRTDPSFVDAVGELAGLMGVGSSGRSSNGSNVSISQENDYISMTASETSGSHFVTLTELVHPWRFLKISDSGQGRFELTLTGPAYLINLQQRPTGVLFIGMIINDTTFAAKTRGFRDFATKHPEQYQTITKILQHIGIQCPPMPDDPQVDYVVHRMLSEIHGDTSPLFEQLVAGLDSSDYRTREKSKESLNNSWDQFRDSIVAAVASGDHSPEVYSALKAIVDANKSVTNDTRYEEFVSREGLLSSPEYLVNLLNAPGDYATGPLIKQLEKITGQNLGDDVQAWNDWLKSQPNSPEPDRR